MGESVRREDLACSTCGGAEAVTLLLWKKYYRDSRTEAVLDAEIICPACTERFMTASTGLYERKPMLIPFGDLAEYPPQRIGYLTGTKGWESNVLAGRFWRRKIWRIRAIWAGRKQKEARLADLP